MLQKPPSCCIMPLEWQKAHLCLSSAPITAHPCYWVIQQYWVLGSCQQVNRSTLGKPKNQMFCECKSRYSGVYTLRDKYFPCLPSVVGRAGKLEWSHSNRRWPGLYQSELRTSRIQISLILWISAYQWIKAILSILFLSHTLLNFHTRYTINMKKKRIEQ